MIIKFISPLFSLDLSGYPLSINEENHWFLDRFVSHFTFPLTIFLTPDINRKLGDLITETSSGFETFFIGEFYFNNKVEPAVLEIEEKVSVNLTINIRFGLEELPNYNKPLNQLPLEYLVLSTSIYTHASTKINLTYPETNYNFVAVHSNKFDTSQPQWEAFEGVINKRLSNSWVENEYDAVNNKQLNKNIMQPQPYLMHVIKTGVEDAGYILAGDFLEDPDFKHAVLSEISEYYSSISTQSEDVLILMSENYNTTVLYGLDYGNYTHIHTLPEHGRYKIAGNLFLRNLHDFVICYVRIRFNDQILLTYVTAFPADNSYQVDLNIDFLNGPGEIKITSTQICGFTNTNGEYVNDKPIADLSITQLSKYNASGELEPTLLLPTDIKLTECVPNIVFGELITVLKKYKNIDVDIKDQVFYINSINKQLEAAPIANLTPFEVPNPIKKYSKGDTFLFKFREISSDEYSFNELYITKTGITTGNYNKDNTTEIIINALPLPLVDKNNIFTADHFIDDKSLIKLIVFNGESSSSNLAQDNIKFQLQSVYQQDHEKWINILINSVSRTWSFTATEEKLQNLTIKSKAYAYHNYHVIKSINKDLIGDRLWSVEIEIKSIPFLLPNNVLD